MGPLFSFFPLILIVIYIGIPFAIIYFFYKKYENLAHIRNVELMKQNEALQRIANALEKNEDRKSE